MQKISVMLTAVLLLFFCRIDCYASRQSNQVALPSTSVLPAFEAAVIRKVSPRTEQNGSWSLPGNGRFEAKSLSLEFLIQMAFNKSEKQIYNMPKWAKYEVFDIVAKPEEGVMLSREELRPRLKSLLKQRFHLLSHVEIRAEPGYALVLAKSGGKLEAGKGDTTENFRKNVSPGRLQGLNWSMAFLAQMLSLSLHENVADYTDKKGQYNINVEYAPDIAVDSPLPSLTTALKDSLGLSLEKRQIPVEVLVIDSLDRAPTEN